MELCFVASSVPSQHHCRSFTSDGFLVRHPPRIAGNAEACTCDRQLLLSNLHTPRTPRAIRSLFDSSRNKKKKQVGMLLTTRKQDTRLKLKVNELTVLLNWFFFTSPRVTEHKSRVRAKNYVDPSVSLLLRLQPHPHMMRELLQHHSTLVSFRSFLTHRSPSALHRTSVCMQSTVFPWCKC